MDKAAWNEYQRNWRAKNKDRVARYKKNWMERNPDWSAPYQRERRAKARASLLEGMACSICGESDPDVLEWHHTNPSEREDGIPNLVLGNPEGLAHELEKCELLCANCHRKQHRGMNVHRIYHNR